MTDQTPTTDQTAEIERLRTENDRLRAERDEARNQCTEQEQQHEFAMEEARGRLAQADRAYAQLLGDRDRLRTESRNRADETQPAQPDTLPAWLHWRFGPHGQPWSDVPDADKTLWEHQARAVRRAVARNGFKADVKAGGE